MVIGEEVGEGVGEAVGSPRRRWRGAESCCVERQACVLRNELGGFPNLEAREIV